MTEEISINLPELPIGKEFEDYIAAFFQSTGFFIEKSISEKNVEELLELDISITDYDILPRPRLIEIKSGEWGFKDVFKVKGWMIYTSISKGYFIVQKGRDNFEFYRRKAKELGIYLISVPDLTKTNHYLRKQLKKRTADPYDVETFRYAYWVEREFLRLVTARKKSNKSCKRYAKLEKYQFNVNSNTYFTNNLLDKTKQLYANYIECPNLSAKCANEMIGNKFELNHSMIPSEIFSKTFYNCEYNDIQISTYFEHQSRLRILKCAVDYLMFKEVKNKRAEDKDTLLGFEISKFSFLPISFSKGIDEIGTHLYYRKYPVFWQWFMLAFGGFILLDKKEIEYELLSVKTGVPVNEIENALNVMDILFPIQNGWLYKNPKTNVLELKFYSIPFRGIGANYRRFQYCKNEDGSEGNYTRLNIRNRFTMSDIIKWNNLCVSVLHKSIFNIHL